MREIAALATGVLLDPEALATARSAVADAIEYQTAMAGQGS